MDTATLIAALAAIISALAALAASAWARRSHEEAREANKIAAEAKMTAENALALEYQRRGDELRPQITVTYDHRDKRGPHGVLTIECAGPLDYNAARIDPADSETDQPIIGVCELDELPDGPFTLERGIGRLPLGGARHLAVKKADRFDRGTLRLRITCWAQDVRGEDAWVESAAVEITSPGRVSM